MKAQIDLTRKQARFEVIKAVAALTAAAGVIIGAAVALATWMHFYVH